MSPPVPSVEFGSLAMGKASGTFPRVGTIRPLRHGVPPPHPLSGTRPELLRGSKAARAWNSIKKLSWFNNRNSKGIKGSK